MQLCPPKTLFVSSALIVAISLSESTDSISLKAAISEQRCVSLWEHEALLSLSGGCAAAASAPPCLGGCSPRTEEGPDLPG